MVLVLRIDGFFDVEHLNYSNCFSKVFHAMHDRPNTETNEIDSSKSQIRIQYFTSLTKSSSCAKILMNDLGKPSTHHFKSVT